MSTTDQMLAESRKKSLLQYVSEGANDADLEAAGYTPAEIAAAFPPTKPVVTSKEFDRDRQAAPNRSTLEAYNPTFRDNLRENVRRGVSALGVSDQTAQFYAGRMAGTGGDMGLVDVTGLGVIPQVQEGIQQAERGYKTGNKTEMAVGALGAGLGVLSAIPGGTVIAKGISKGTEKLAEAAVRNYDPALLRTVGTPSDQTVKALGIGPEKNPVFLPRETTSENLIDFYSPVKNTVDTMDFGNGSIPGNVVLKHLREKAPNMNRAELTSYKLNLDPNTRYTREEVQALLPDTNYSVREVPLDTSRLKEFSELQLQKTKVETNEPFVIALQGNKPTDFSHFSKNDLGHLRGSYLPNAEGKKRILLQEAQSDILQNTEGKNTPVDPVRNYLANLEFDLGESLSYNGISEDKILELFDARKKGTLTDKEVNQGLYSVFKFRPESISGKPEYLLDTLTERLFVQNSSDRSAEEIADKFYSLSIDLDKDVKKAAVVYPKKEDIPLSGTTDVVKKLMLGLIAKAQRDGVTEIVIPPLERIAVERVADFPSREAAEKALKATYVDAMDKALGLLNKEFSSKTNTNPLNIFEDSLSFKKSGYLKAKDEKVKVVDISNFPNLNDKKLKFAAGGLVGYSQGGSVEDEQMDRLMQEGGIAATDATKEPVTGNEVPPGAMPSEVRDDISAQLSEGEYVVPADVVRFFGVKFFEDLRSQAKQGLAEMQSDGRIGGAAVDDNGIPMEQEDEELTPEEEQMLQNALGQTGMAEGGFVPFDRTTFTLDSPVSSETRKYIDPKTGETKEFKFLYGAPLETIPANYVPWTQELADAAAKPATPTTPLAGTTPSREKDSKPLAPATNANTQAGEGISYNNWAEKNYEAITADPYTFGINALKDETGKNLSKGLTIAGAVTANPLLAGAGAITKASNKMQNIAEANAALHLMEAKGLANSDQYNSLKGAIDVAVKSLPGVQQFAVEHDMAATGNQYLKSIAKISETKTDGKVTAAAPTVKTPPTESSKSSDKKDTNVGYGAGKVDPGLAKAAAAVKSTPAPASAPAAKPTPSRVADEGGPGTKTPVKTTIKAPANAGSTRFKEGGLATRTTKTAPKTKGLAGKQ